MRSTVAWVLSTVFSLDMELRRNALACEIADSLIGRMATSANAVLLFILILFLNADEFSGLIQQHVTSGHARVATYACCNSAEMEDTKGQGSGQDEREEEVSQVLRGRAWIHPPGMLKRDRGTTPNVGSKSPCVDIKHSL